MSTINDLPDYPGAKSSKDGKKFSARLPQGLRGLEKTFATITEAAWMSDSDRRILIANEALGRVLGYTPAEMEGRHCYELVHSSAHPIPDCPFESARSSMRRETISFKEGGKILRGIVYPIGDKAGTFIGAVHTLKKDGDGKESAMATPRPGDRKK